MLNNAIRLDELWKQFTFPFRAIIRNLFCAGIFLFFVQMFCFDIKAQWSPQTSGTANNLFSIHFINTNIGWAVGGNNTILQTVNGGTTWSPVAGPGGLPTSSYLGVRFIDSNTGWVGGGSVVLRTADGGSNWDSLVDLNANNFRNNLFAVSSTQAWAPIRNGLANARYFARYTSSGGTINEEGFDLLTSSVSFFDIYFTDIDNGWSVGTSGQIRRITNASGSTPGFAFQTSGTTQTLNGIFMLDSNTGWVVGNTGTILKTTDGGVNWSPQTSGTTTNLRSVHFVNSNTGWAVGESGLIMTTTNGGTTWASQMSGTTQTLRRVFFIGTSNGFVTGFAGTILKNAGPTVSRLTISGRVTDNSGRGISKATITLSGGFNSEQRTALTNPFGYFFFESIEAGSSYIITASRKGFIFTPEYHVFTLNDLRNDINFTVVEN